MEVHADQMVLELSSTKGILIDHSRPRLVIPTILVRNRDIACLDSSGGWP